MSLFIKLNNCATHQLYSIVFLRHITSTVSLTPYTIYYSFFWCFAFHSASSGFYQCFSVFPFLRAVQCFTIRSATLSDILDVLFLFHFGSAVALCVYIPINSLLVHVKPLITSRFLYLLFVLPLLLLNHPPAFSLASQIAGRWFGCVEKSSRESSHFSITHFVLLL